MSGASVSIRASGPESVALVDEQPALDGDPFALRGIHESAERAAAADHAMAGNDERDPVGAARAADRAGARRTMRAISP